MTQSIVDHFWNSLTFFTSLFSLVGKVWAQRWPVLKWIWPRAWDEWREGKQKTIDGISDAAELPGTDRTTSLAKAEDMPRLSATDPASPNGKINSQPERKSADREERLSKTETYRQREGQALTQLEDVADRLKATEEALSTPCKQCVTRESNPASCNLPDPGPRGPVIHGGLPKASEGEVESQARRSPLVRRQTGCGGGPPATNSHFYAVLVTSSLRVKPRRVHGEGW